MNIIKRPDFEKIVGGIFSFFEKSGMHIFISGAIGLGKTTLLKSVMEKYRNSHKCTYINFREIVGLPEHFIGKYHEALSGEKLSFLSGKSDIKDLFFGVIQYPEEERHSPSRIIILDDLEYIASLSNFQDFNKIAVELLESVVTQKHSLYIVSTNTRSFDDVFFTDDIKEILKRWNIIEVEALSFSNSRDLASKLLGEANSNLIDDICLACEGIPAYIQNLASAIIELNLQGFREYGPENFVILLSKVLRKRDGKLSLYLEKVLTTSLSRVRGSTSLLSCLKVLASSDELLLKDVSKELSRSPQAVKDYLDWLIKSGLIEKNGKKYRICDLLMKFWIFLNSTGQSEIEQEIPPDQELLDIILKDMEEKRKSIVKTGIEEKIFDEEPLQRLPQRREELIEFD